MPSTYTPIATQTLGSAAASVTFSSISSAYTDLVLVAQPTASSNGQQFYFRVGNGSVDSGSNYSITMLAGNGTTATSARRSNQTEIIPDYYGAINTTVNGAYIFNFQNYSNTTTYKTVLTSSRTSYAAESTVALWRSTSAINIITFYLTNFTTGSTFTLYGVKSA
jgi:hypothetical protein